MRSALLFLSPWIVGFLIFTAWPMIYSAYLSLTDYDVINDPNFVGFENYAQMATDPKVLLALGNTAFFTLVQVPLYVVVSLALALLLDRAGRASGFFRTVFFLPKMTPPVAVGVLFLLLFNGQNGLLNTVLGWFGIDGPAWTTDPAWVKPGLILMSLWTVGASVIILLAALQQRAGGAVRVGEARRRRFWRTSFSVTLPMISPALFFVIIVNTIAGLQTFDEAYTAFFGAGNTTYSNDAALFYVDLPVPAGVRVPEHGLRVGDGVGVVRGHHDRDGHPAHRLAPLRLLRGGPMTGVDVDLPVGARTGPAPRRERRYRPRPPPFRPPTRRHCAAKVAASGTKASRVFAWVALALLGIVFVYPFVWLVSASFKPRTEVFDNRLIPETFTLDNYVSVWQEAPLGLWLMNTDDRHGARRRDGDVLERHGGLGVLVLPLPGARRAVRPGARHDDAAGRRHHDPHLPHLERTGAGGHPHATLGGQPLRQRVLHLPAAAVLPRTAAGPLRGRAHRRRLAVGGLLAHRPPALQARARRDARLRGAGRLDRPHASAIYLRDSDTFTVPAASSRSSTPSASVASGTGRSSSPRASSRRSR